MTHQPSRARGRLAVGVDIGGTKIVAGLVDADGRVHDRETRQTPDRTTAPHIVEDLVVDAVDDLVQRHEIVGVGVGAAGFVDQARSRVMFAPHLSWRNEPLALRLTRRIDCPVLIENDANAALWAEQKCGRLRGVDDAVLITLGTGIGGAVLVGGRVYRGHNGMAGEFGHVQMVPGGRPCECGRTGCWEQYCSGKALGRFVTEAGSGLDGGAITDAAVAGDPVARGAYAEIGRWLGVGVANVVAGLDPSLVVVGGGLSAGGELLLQPARVALSGALVGAGYREEPAMVVADLGSDAGMIGSALMVLADVDR